ncbi:SPX domain-containing protein [Cantharellus anzutake]|uniref:SPX domain-containing protein n=1 Tax=Cantharellus anzutake TaxID=1750568 RepID=UPI00190386F7|nr:SPX domain-containing protein [Cantharellus anzutake]KAF8339631.1 SPX domain-containing protein [Cantharellus anzutake]
MKFRRVFWLNSVIILIYGARWTNILLVISNSLKFNAVAEWWDEYIAYAALKKVIYDLEREQTYDLGGLDHERSSLLGNGQRTEAVQKFVPLLDRELEKIVTFYISQEEELRSELENLTTGIEAAEDRGVVQDERDEEDDGDSDETSIWGTSSTRRKRSVSTNARPPRQTISLGKLRPHAGAPRAARPQSERERRRSGSLTTALTAPLANLFAHKEPDTIWTAKTTAAWDVRMLFKRRITTLYISATSLKSYVELNYSGFRKILKKFDKITDNSLKEMYMRERVDKDYPFEPATKSHLDEFISELVNHYARCVTRGNQTAALKQLKLYQREQIVWERDTVWRQMIGKERRGENDGQVKSLLSASVQHEAAPPLLAIPTPLGVFKVTGRRIWLAIALTAFIALLNTRVLDGREANRCFAVLIFATILWASEAIPLFVTSTSVPFMVVVLRIIRDENGWIFSVMFSPTIMLLLGGFTLSSALSKTNIDRILITRVLSLAGTRPSTVILAFMGVACFASMWISNVAAPALCFALIRPILSSLPPKSTFAPCLIMSIALAANIGGQSSPISSPQNIIALNEMVPPIDWLQWFAVALPVSGLSIVLIWLLLLSIYRPSTTADGKKLQVKPIRPTRDKFTPQQYWVTFVCLVTIALWCVAHEIEVFFGDMGTIAIIPIVAFFGSGVLKKADFDQFLWSIVFLAMGGIALGKAVVSSGLLQQMDVVIRGLVLGLPLYSVVLALSCVVMIVSTFISHTIASVLLVPIAREVGSNLPVPHPRLLIFITGLVCSTGMGMPVSGFPNQTAATQEDDMGELYLSNIDFLKCGVPASIIAALVVSTVGYLLMRAIGCVWCLFPAVLQ